MDSQGIDSIELTSELCRRLYSNGIVNLDFSARKPKPELIYSGKNNQHVLVAIDMSAGLKKDDQSFLEKLLKACDLAMEDIALVNMKDLEVQFSEVIRQLQIKKCILFGIPLLSIDLPIGSAEETAIIFDDKYFIRTASLPSLQHDAAKKKALWHALKNMFGV